MEATMLIAPEALTRSDSTVGPAALVWRIVYEFRHPRPEPEDLLLTST